MGIYSSFTMPYFQGFVAEFAPSQRMPFSKTTYAFLITFVVFIFFPLSFNWINLKNRNRNDYIVVALAQVTPKSESKQPFS